MTRPHKRLLVHMHMHGEDFVEAVFVGVDVNHPAENYGVEAAACGVARVLRGDGAVQTKFGAIHGECVAFWRHAQIGVQVPHGDAERHALV